MNTWNNPNFPACDKPTSNHCQTPKDAVCCNCGWMFSDHKKNVIQEVWFCPDAPTMPGYPRLQKWSWATEQQQYLSEIQELKRQVSEVSKWNMDLQKQRNESDFRINNLLNQQSKSTHEACEQQKKIKQLEDQLQKVMCGDNCYHNRLRLEETVEELIKSKNQLRNELCEAQKRDTYASYEIANNSRKDLIKRCDEFRLQNDNFKVIIESLENDLKKERAYAGLKVDEVNKWKYEYYEKEREILVVQEKFQQKEKELKDTLKSKTISVHNYYQSPSKWEPIEIAPKDGSAVILCDPSVWGKFIVIGCYVKPDGWIFNTRLGDGEHLKLHNPTHWMPLPQAPQ